MADMNKNGASVELSDALHSGFSDAMDRVKSLNLDPCGTLVDQIPEDHWKSWDESNENPMVCDSDDIDGNGEDTESEPLAA